MHRWWIDEDRVLGSSNPTTAELEALYEEGFRTILSLLDEDEQLPAYDVEQALEMGFQRHSLPIPDYAAPSPAQYDAFLDLVERGLKQGKVVVHCQGGLGRTGTMGGAYWICRGDTAAEAIERVRRARLGAVERATQEQSLYDLEARLARAE